MEKTKFPPLLIFSIILLLFTPQVQAGPFSWLKSLLGIQEKITRSYFNAEIALYEQFEERAMKMQEARRNFLELHKGQLSDEEVLAMHMSHHPPHYTPDRIDEIRNDLRQFLESPLDILREHPDRILDNDETRKIYLSLVLSHIDPNNADEMALFTDSVIGGFLRKNESSPDVFEELDSLWKDVLVSTRNTLMKGSDIEVGVMNVLLNDDFVYAGRLMDETSSFSLSRIARVHGHPNLRLPPGNAALMSRMMESLRFPTSSWCFDQAYEILFFWKYTRIDPDSPVYREGIDFLEDRMNGLGTPVPIGIEYPNGYPLQFEAFLTAAREDRSFGMFVKKSLKSLRKGHERVEKIKNEFSNLWHRDREKYDSILNTPGLEGFSIEDWERILEI